MDGNSSSIRVVVAVCRIVVLSVAYYFFVTSCLCLPTSTTTGFSILKQQQQQQRSSPLQPYSQSSWKRQQSSSFTIMASSSLSSSSSADAVTVEDSTTTTETASSSPPPPVVISGMKEIVQKYDYFLIDMWGVMHDGIQCYDGVIDCIHQLNNFNDDDDKNSNNNKKNKKELIILSNSSKRKDNSHKMLTKLGLDPLKNFTQIITSGEVAHHLLRHLAVRGLKDDIDDDDESSALSSSWVPTNIPEPFLQTSSSNLKVFCFGSGDGDVEYLQSCGWDLANDMTDADLIVARGPFTIITAQGQISRQQQDESSSSSTSLYETAMEEALKIAARRRVPMIVANPDKVRPDADKSPMPGTIGVAYEKALQKLSTDDTGGDGGDILSESDIDQLILYLGKPFGDVYEIALRGKDLSKAVMIGDALETDITGANTAGIDSVWVIQDGIHNEDVAAATNKGGASSTGSMEDGCNTVLNNFNKLEGTYAKGRQLRPTYITEHFRY